MTMKYVYTPHPDLLAKAKNVFGDLVVKAFLVGYDHPHYTAEQNEARRAKEIKLLSDILAQDDRDNNHLSYDYMTIRMEFCNGHVVDFTNSEWASMTRVHP